MSATFLFLPPAPEHGWRWVRIAGDRVAGRGEGLPAGDDARVIAVAPADAVTLHWAELPDRSTAQAAAAARIVVADASAEPGEALHVAVGAPGDGGERAIGVVSSVRMRGWLDALAAAAIDPVAIVPAPLLLPQPPGDAYVRADLEGQPVVRGPNAGFADEALLTRLVTGGAAPETLGRDAVDMALVAAATDLPLDLRQGPFARRRRRAIDWPLVRRLALLGALILLVTLAIDVVRIARLSLAAHAAETRIEALARQGLPRDAGAGDAERLLTERLARLRGPGAGFTASAAALGTAVRDTPGTEVTALNFDPNGDLRAAVAADGEGQVNALVGRLRARGLTVRPSTFENAGGRMRGEVTVVAP